MHIADRSLFLAISRLLWAFDFHRAVDPDTNEEIIPDMNNLADGVMAFPKPFPASIMPRDDRKAQAVKEEWQKMTGLLDEYSQWKTVPEGLILKVGRLSG